MHVQTLRVVGYRLQGHMSGLSTNRFGRSSQPACGWKRHQMLTHLLWVTACSGMLRFVLCMLHAAERGSLLQVSSQPFPPVHW